MVTMKSFFDSHQNNQPPKQTVLTKTEDKIRILLIELHGSFTRDRAKKITDTIGGNNLILSCITRDSDSALNSLRNKVVENEQRIIPYNILMIDGGALSNKLMQYVISKNQSKSIPTQTIILDCDSGEMKYPDNFSCLDKTFSSTELADLLLKIIPNHPVIRSSNEVKFEQF